MSSKLIGGALLALALFTTAVSATTAFTQRQRAGCQAKYNASVTAAIKARSTATDQDRAALDRMVATIATATSRPVIHEALDRYVKDRKAADEAREQNPLPDPPPSSECSVR